MEPFRRKEMTKYNDGVTALPQLRVNGVFVGGGDAVQASPRWPHARGRAFRACVEQPTGCAHTQQSLGSARQSVACGLRRKHEP